MMSRILFPSIKVLFALVIISHSSLLIGQGISFEERSKIENPNSNSCYSSQIDRLNRPYLYTANLGQGLKIYDIEDEENPIQRGGFEISAFEGQWVSNVIQYGTKLYLSLGDFQGATRPAGIAIIDVSEPASPLLDGYQFFTAFDKGCAITRVKDDVAYLGLMDHGVLAVDISNPSNITEIKHITFDDDFPEPPGLFTKPHARGMDIYEDFLFVCYDAGGLRVVDISQPELAAEKHMYVNEELDAVSNVVYNNIDIENGKGYIALDYCGVEVVDLSDPLDIKFENLYNPNDCNGTNWVGSPSHTNEIIHDGHHLFVSAGDSEIWSFDTSDDLKLNGSYSMVLDSSVTWGLDVHNGHAVGNFINVAPVYLPGLTPYYSNWGGWRLYSIRNLTSIEDFDQADKDLVFPNPTDHYITLQTEDVASWSIYNTFGTLLSKGQPSTRTIDLSSYPQGIYLLNIRGENNRNHVVVKN